LAHHDFATLQCLQRDVGLVFAGYPELPELDVLIVRVLEQNVITSGRGLFELEFAALVCLLPGYQPAGLIKELQSRTGDCHFRITVNNHSG